MASTPWWLRLRRQAGRIRRRFAVDTYDVFVRRVPKPGDDDADVTVPAGYRFAFGSEDDVRACEEEHTELDARERALGAARLGLGHRVALGFHGALCVFSMWVNPRHLNVPGLVKRKLAPSQWFIYKAFTSPEHRGRGLYETGMRFVLAEMGRQGLDELVGYAHVKKKVSRKGLAALRFESVGRVVQYRAPGFLATRPDRDFERRFPEATPRSGALDDVASGSAGVPRGEVTAS